MTDIVDMGRGPTWTTKEVLKLRSYAERGLSMAEASVLLSRAYWGVVDKVRQLDIKFSGPVGPPLGSNNAAKWNIRRAFLAKHPPRNRNRQKQRGS